MKTARIGLCLVIMLSITLVSSSASEKVTVATLPFENTGVFEHFDYLRTLLPLFLTSALIDIPEVELVKRTDIQALLAEKKLGLAGLTAGEVGKALGADILIKGSFEEEPVPGEDVRKAKLIIHFSLEETISGKIIATQEVKGSVDHLEETIQETVDKVVASLSSMNNIVIKKTPKLRHFEAVKYFQQGKEIIKRENYSTYSEKDYKRALELFRRAAYLLPEWDKAWFEVGSCLSQPGYGDEARLDEAYQNFERVLKLTADPDIAGKAMLEQGHIWFERSRRSLYGAEKFRSPGRGIKDLVSSQETYIKLARTYPHHRKEVANALVNALNAPGYARSPEIDKLAIEAGNILIKYYGAAPMGTIGYQGLETVAGFARGRITKILLVWKGPEKALDYLIPLLESTDNLRTLFRLNRLAGKIYEEIYMISAGPQHITKKRLRLLKRRVPVVRKWKPARNVSGYIYQGGRNRAGPLPFGWKMMGF